MIRLIGCILYMSGYLIYSLPKLNKLKKLPIEIPVPQRDALTHETPKYWSRKILSITGCNVILTGNQDIPDGPVIFVSNHEGDFDIPVLLGSIDKPFGFISKIEIKKIPIISSWMEQMNCVFLDRKNRKKAYDAISEGVELIMEGHSLVIFPEGTRSKGGPIGQFKSGGFKLAKESGYPIVPISIEGTSGVFEKNRYSIKPSTIQVNICPPIFYHEYKDKDLNVLADEVRSRIIDIRRRNKIAS